MLMLGISSGGSGIGGTMGAGASVCVEEVVIFGSGFGVSISAAEASRRSYTEFGVFGGVNGTSTVCEADDTIRRGVAGGSIVGGKLTLFFR